MPERCACLNRSALQISRNVPHFDAFVAQSLSPGPLASAHGGELRDFRLNHSAGEAKRDATPKNIMSQSGYRRRKRRIPSAPETFQLKHHGNGVRLYVSPSFRIIFTEITELESESEEG